MTPTAARDMHRRQIGQHGETVVLRRYSGTGGSRTSVDYSVRAKVAGYDANELVGGIIQGDSKLIVLAEDIEAIAFPLPIVKGDKVVVAGRELNIERADDKTRRIAGVLIAIELQARG